MWEQSTSEEANKINNSKNVGSEENKEKNEQPEDTLNSISLNLISH